MSQEDTKGRYGGIHLTYRADPNDLNAANLAQYDALNVDATHETITPEHEKAPLDFVAGGKGLPAAARGVVLLPALAGVPGAETNS